MLQCDHNGRVKQAMVVQAVQLTACTAIAKRDTNKQRVRAQCAALNQPKRMSAGGLSVAGNTEAP